MKNSNEEAINNNFMKKFLSNKLVKKFLTKEVILYAIFGLLTTAVNIGSF